MTTETFPTELADRILHAWTRAGFGVMQVGMELAFDRPLDSERLAVAFEKLHAWEPLIGCRFAEDGAGRTWWEPVQRYLPLEIAADPNAYRRFLTTPLRAGEEAQVKACLEKSGTRLAILMSHELADAGGMKELAARLARYYHQAEAPSPASGSRSMNPVLERLTGSQRWAAMVDSARMLARTRRPRATVHLRQTGAVEDGFEWIVEHVNRETVSALRAWGRGREATLNDLLLAAFLTAMHRETEAPPGARLRAMSTVDLRRYLPEKRAERLCNLSGFEVTTLSDRAGGDFEATLAEVVRETGARKQRQIGLAGSVGAPMLESLSQKRLDGLFRYLFDGWRSGDNLAPSLTNMGAIDEIDFDGQAPRSAWMIVPPHAPPHLGVGVSGYRGSLTLTAAATPSFAPKLRSFFRTMAGLLSTATAREGEAA